ncbi:histamine H2 receptor-like [Parasteatoda tepidariorum]|uniref:histamine H2 receptor-like n=1 Tax=Parasteatoda tepidariorum TaxID=114398 RepID=UPI001C724BDD|nr:histamine H2 receptor-like [Parasteatoda tepidariorum]
MYIVFFPAILVPSMIPSIRGWMFNQHWCKAVHFFTVFLNLACVLSILLIAIDRNCAVNSPLHYTITITKKRTGLLIVSIWAISFILAAPILLGIRQSASPPGIVDIAYSLLIGFIGFVLPLLSVAFLYFAMFRAAQNNNARARRSSSNSNTSNEIVVSVKPPKKQGVTEYCLRRNFSSERVEDSSCCFAGRHKAAITGLLVVLSFLACWLPFYTILVSELFANISDNIKYCANFAAYMSCVINPYLYFFRNKTTWKEAKMIAVAIFSTKEKLLGKNSVEKHARKCTVDASACLFRLPSSFSQPMLATPTTHLNACIDLSQQTVGLNVKTQPIKMRSVFSLDPIKPLLHQDSSSSNDSSDACVTTLVTDSVLSIDQDSLFWYPAIQP